VINISALPTTHLVPAYGYSNASEGGVEHLEPGVPRGEVELLAVAGPVGDVRLAVDAQNLAVRIDYLPSMIELTNHKIYKYLNAASKKYIAILTAMEL
jgi:hypothetical protein